MTWYGRYFCLGIIASLPLAAAGQARPTGDGLQGAYYDGHNFEQYVLTRRDPTINFDWHGQSPAAGLPAEQFSVRWTGWLVPPTTGHYVLHVSADDGIRLWLNGRELLNEWRGQSLSYYQLAVDLKAGEAYALRVDYCQYSYSTRARLAWAPPPTPSPSENWRNLWGLTKEDEGPVVIPSRYLFSKRPTPALVSAPTLASPVASAAPSPPPAPAAPRLVAASRAALLPQPANRIRPVPLSRLRPTPVAAVASALVPLRAMANPDSGRVAAVASRLAAGQAVTLRALYFEQGKAELPPLVQASLDTLAMALASRPTLRLEVQGHTDNQGDPSINQQLSRRRADAVCRYLAAQGVAAERLRAVGYGGSRPVADNRQPDQRPRNRRVVLRPLP
ncbi:MAG: PA14 domain-containing protein [Janthinobacterium lividum]